MQLSDKASRIRLIAMDVDGVLTDGSLFYTPKGEEIKVFSVKDGMGITLAKHAGLEVAIITGRSSEALRIRARELGVSQLRMGAADKASALDEIETALEIQPWQVAFIGDDLNDLNVMRHVGMAVAVADSSAEILEIAHYVTKNPGGRGAVREVVEFILKHQGHWEQAIAAVQGNSGQ